MKARVLQKLGIVAFLTAALAAPLRADPDFEINTGAGWTTALANGSIGPIASFSDLAFLGYNSSLFAVPTLSVSGDSLNVGFGGNEEFGGFAYNFPVDLNLNGKRLSLDVNSKYGTDYFWVITDNSWHHKEFHFTGTGNEISLNINAGANSLSGITDTAQNPVPVTVTIESGFDLSDVMDTAGMLLIMRGSDGLPHIIRGLDVVPEPSTLALLGLGTLSLLARDWRRRTAKA